jgi:hypothetical protein
MEGVVTGKIQEPGPILLWRAVWARASVDAYFSKWACETVTGTTRADVGLVFVEFGRATNLAAQYRLRLVTIYRVVIAVEWVVVVSKCLF